MSMYNRRKYITGRTDFYTQVHRENMYGRGNGYRNMNYHDMRVRNPMGYGTQLSPSVSARLNKQVRMARTDLGPGQFGMHRVSGPARRFESGDLEKRVQQILKQLGKRYNGARVCKEYQGILYEGIVTNAVWNRSVGYGVRLVYSDGFR